MISIKCPICDKSFFVKNNRIKSGITLCCSRHCASRLKQKKNKKVINEKINALGTKQCSCGCGQIITPLYRNGKIIFNNFIHGHNNDFNDPKKRKNQSEASKKWWTQFNAILSEEKRKIIKNKSTQTLRKKYAIKIFGFDYTKIPKGRLNFKPWNTGKTIETDPRIEKYASVIRGRNKKTGYEPAIRASERMKKNNPVWNPKIKEKMLQAYKLSPNKLEKIIINKNYPNLIFTGDRQFWITFKNGQYKNPDFVVKPFSKTKKVVEVWGGYWHRNHNSDELRQLYSERNINCLILPEADIKNKKYETILEDFLCPII